MTETTTHSTHKKQILKSASVISVITVASRILGYVRDQRLTLLLGTTGIADSFILAYRIPNVLRRLVGEGSMTAAFIPVFTEYMGNKSREETWAFANRLFWTFSIVMAALTVLGVIFSPLVVRLFSMFGKSQVQVQAVYLNRLMFPYVMFIGMAALAMAILNCFHIFALPAATPILLNISFIVFSVAAVWKYFSSPAAALAVGVLIGGIFQFFLQVPQLVRRGMNFQFKISFTDPGVRRVAKLMVPGFLGIGIAQINLLVDTIFANAKIMPQGSLISLYVADRMTELVLGGYAVAVATAILPMMSHQALAGDREGMKKTFIFSVRIVSFITIPAAVGLVILREPIVQVLFQHGLFVAESTRLTARALLYYSMGLPAFAAIKLVVPAFYATQDTRTPVRVAMFTLALNIVLNLIFLFYFFAKFKNGAPALASALAGYFNVSVLFVIFRLRFGRLGTRKVLLSLGKISLCAAIMGIACWGMLHYSRFDTIAHFLPRLAVFAGMIITAALTYLGLAWLFRCDEIGEVYGIAFHRDQREAGGSGLTG
ncbi:MAG TPA: murein biosynthesis integral membrane protein MurJ [Candidatus Dormibacteraeota bacterium]|nr:murein biosynthesis integral membrane protein MurJ [Candidatus Dormibacteraeota bacterium]